MPTYKALPLCTACASLRQSLPSAYFHRRDANRKYRRNPVPSAAGSDRGWRADIFANYRCHRGRPHGVACFRRHNQLVAIGGKILAQQAAKIFLRAAGRRPVVIRQIEMGNARVKGLAQQGALVIQRVTVAKVVPQPQRQEGQLQAALPQ